MRRTTMRLMSVSIMAALLAGCPVAGVGMRVPATPATEPTSLVKLGVDGRDIVAAAGGAVVRLRGVSVAGGVWGHPGQPSTAVTYHTTEADIARIKSWGANAITFYMDWTWFQEPGGWTFVNDVFNWCRKHDVYVVPSLTFYPEGGLRGGNRFWNSLPAKTKLRDFWVRFARAFRGREEIAGYDLLNEPQADDLTVDALRAYVTSLVDAVRKEDPDTSIYIEPEWGSVFNAFTVDRPNLVYNFHYYEPFSYTSQGFPWICEGSVPMTGSYPGACLQPFSPRSSVYRPNSPAGTYDWTLVTESVSVPADAQYLFFKVFSNGDAGATLYFDDVRYSRGGGGSGTFVNGSFEEQNDCSANPVYFYSWFRSGGAGARTAAEAYDGSWSVRLSGCADWGHWANYDENWWVGDAAALPVVPGETINLSYRVKAVNSAAGKNGLLVWFASAATFTADGAWLANDINDNLAAFSAAHEVPVFVGEFTASLAGRRPDILAYIEDTIDCLDAAGLSWTYYVYRENWTGSRKYLGIYNGPPGATVESGGCTEQTDVLDLLRLKF